MVDDTGVVSQGEVGDEANFPTTKLPVDSTFDIICAAVCYALPIHFIQLSFQ